MRELDEKALQAAIEALKGARTLNSLRVSVETAVRAYLDAALAEKGEGDDWQPIQTAPMDGTTILTLRRDMGQWLACVAKWAVNYKGSGYYRDHGWMAVGYQGIAHDGVSPPPEYWQPLPKPLQQGAK